MSSLLTADEQEAAEKAPERALAPEGIYICRVKEVERWSTGTSLRWIFKVAHGQRYAGKEFWAWTGIKAETIGFTKTYLAALGFSLDADPDDIAGTPCKIRVTVEARTDTGEPANKVKQVFPYDGPPLPEEPSSFDAGIPAEFGPSDNGDELV
jgi:hypothetical protein